MNRHVNDTAGRLSLRPPQRRSLELLDRITEIAPPAKVRVGSLPRRALALVLEWATSQRAQLLDNWELCGQHYPPKRIRPLD